MRTVEEIEAELKAASEEHTDTVAKLIKDSNAVDNQYYEKRRALAQELKNAKEALRKENDLEKSFKKAAEDFKVEVQKHLDAAVAAYNEAKALSRKTGIPFETPIVLLDDYKDWDIKGTDTYVPSTFDKKWPGVREYDEDLEGAIIDELFELSHHDNVRMQGNWFPSTLRC